MYVINLGIIMGIRSAPTRSIPTLINFNPINSNPMNYSPINSNLNQFQLDQFQPKLIPTRIDSNPSNLRTIKHINCSKFCGMQKKIMNIENFDVKNFELFLDG